MRNFIIIVNPAAGKAQFRDKIAYLKHELMHHGYGFELEYTNPDEDPDRITQLVYEHQPSDCIVMGGDGTLNYAVNALSDSNIPLSVISNGTGNDALRSIHNEFNFHKQVDIALNGSVKKFDLGLCNKRYFMNGVGFGFDGEVVYNMLKKGKRYAGHMAYLSTVIQLLFKYTSKEFQANIDGTLHTKKLFMMTIANGTTFGGGFKTNPKACMHDGQLDLLTIAPISLLTRPVCLVTLQMTCHERLSYTSMQKIKSITLRKSPFLYGHIDGELLEPSDYAISVLPEKISFRVP